MRALYVPVPDDVLARLVELARAEFREPKHLVELARAEFREPKHQAAALIVEGLRRAEAEHRDREPAVVVQRDGRRP